MKRVRCRGHTHLRTAGPPSPGRSTAHVHGRESMNAHPVNIYGARRWPGGRWGGGYDFIAGGATDEITLRRTRAVFDAIMRGRA